MRRHPLHEEIEIQLSPQVNEDVRWGFHERLFAEIEGIECRMMDVSGKGGCCTETS